MCTTAKSKHLQQCHSLIPPARIRDVMFSHLKLLRIQTTDKVSRVHAEQALPSQPLGMSTAHVYSSLQMAVSEPLWQPLQLAIAKQAAGVQNSAEMR